MKRRVLLIWALALAGAAASVQAREKLPSITDTEDVIDWIRKWAGAEFYPSQYGPPGWPGKDPELMGLYGYRGNNWGWPEMIPYPNAPEHIRTYMQRYIPMYPLYNAGTLVKNLRVTELPGLAKERIVQYPEPVYRVPKYRYANPPRGIFSDAIKLGKYRRPVTVLRFDQHHPPIELDLGRLKESAYAVRIIAATESEKVQQSTKRLIIHFEVNDGPEGEVNAYKKRCAASDQFYSMAEFFFMAPVEREYKIKLWIDATSELPLYVYNIDVHDRLGQIANRAGKKTASFFDEKERAAKWRAAKGGIRKDARSKKERFDADAELWQNLPRMNSQLRGGGRFWTTAVESIYRLPQNKVDDGMGIDVYGSDMIWNVPEEEYAGSRYELRYQAAALTGRYWNLQRQTYYGKAKEYDLKVARLRRGYWWRDLQKYQTTGDEIAGRAVAVRMAMIAWMNIFNLDGSRQRMRVIDCIPEITWNLGDQAFRRRTPCHHRQLEKVEEFDSVWPYIRGNRDLAESLGRFIPWIRTTEDMQRFFEVGLLQLPAHENMIYQRYNGYKQGVWMTFYVGAQQDKEITKPWMEWTFRYVWTYPRMPAGIDETMFMSWTRDGTTTIGSTFYAHASITALRDILRNLSSLAGDPSRVLPEKLRAPELKSRAKWEGRFSQDAMVAGGYRFWVGDVSGPSRSRWKVGGGKRGSPPAPKIDAKNKTRVLSNWFGVLETGQEQEDFRHRRAAGLRVGNGMGHSHNDPLDLQIWGLGVPLSGDWGCRGGYCVPGTKATMSHNTVVAGALLDDCRHRWISSIADTAGARYLMGQVKCPGLYGRQLALIDIDDPTPGSYVVDIFRVRGGNKPYYAFHGPPPDEFYTNIEKLEKGYPDGSPGPLFDPKHNWHGKIPARFTANWRMRRDPGEVEWTPSPTLTTKGVSFRSCVWRS